MADNKRYYYLKLKENFFDSDEMILLESMPDGYIYSNILLKLYLRSLKHEGKLMFNDRIPFNSTMLATITRHSVGVVEKAVQIFCDLQLIDVLDNGAIYMSDIQSFIGKSSTEADRKRDYRKKIEEAKKNLITGGQMSDKCPDKTTPELELEKELDIEKDINIKSLDDDDVGVYEFIQKTWGKPPTGILQGALGSMIKNWGSDMILFAFKLAFENSVEMQGLKKYVEVILKSWANRGIKTIGDAEKDQEAFKNKKKQNYVPKRQNNVRRETLPDWVNQPKEEKTIDPQQKAEIDARFEAYLAQKAQKEKEDDC
ncbi:hypothetical protein IGJ83_002459 [Enterococcus pernyi]